MSAAIPGENEHTARFFISKARANNRIEKSHKHSPWVDSSSWLPPCCHFEKMARQGKDVDVSFSPLTPDKSSELTGRANTIYAVYPTILQLENRPVWRSSSHTHHRHTSHCTN